jgi:hypothetical protein
MTDAHVEQNDKAWQQLRETEWADEHEGEEAFTEAEKDAITQVTREGSARTMATAKDTGETRWELCTCNDDLVCQECAARAGRAFRVGIDPMPPLHHGCRCRAGLLLDEESGEEDDSALPFRLVFDDGPTLTAHVEAAPIPPKRGLFSRLRRGNS